MKEQTSVISGRQTMPDWAFVLWAGGTALLSYSLVQGRLCLTYRVEHIL